jgi:hypothetical protein
MNDVDNAQLADIQAQIAKLTEDQAAEADTAALAAAAGES